MSEKLYMEEVIDNDTHIIIIIATCTLEGSLTDLLDTIALDVHFFNKRLFCYQYRQKALQLFECWYHPIL